MEFSMTNTPATYIDCFSHVRSNEGIKEVLVITLLLTNKIIILRIKLD